MKEMRPITRTAWSPAEAAESLGVSRTTFDAEILPSLRVVRVGRRILVPRREIEAWLEREAAVLLESERR